MSQILLAIILSVETSRQRLASKWRRWDTGYSLDVLAGEAIRRFVALGFLEDTGPRVRLTRDGLLVSDSMWPDLLG